MDTEASSCRPGGPTLRTPLRGGMGLAVLSAATFGTSGTFGSALVHAGWSPAAAVLARVAAAMLILTVPALLSLRGRWALLRRHAGRAVAFGVVAVAGCQLCFFSALRHLPVGVALLIEYLGPVLVVGWLWLRYGQRPAKLTVSGAAAAFAGLTLVLNLTGSGPVSPIGVMWALLAAMGLAVYFLLSAAPAAEPLPPLVMTWASLAVGTIVLAGLALIGVLRLSASAGPVDLVGRQVSWVVPVVGLSLVATVISYVTGIGAARILGARLASFLAMAEVLFAILFAWALLGQMPSGIQFVGGGLILAGVTLVRLAEMRATTAPGGRPKPAIRPRPPELAGSPTAGR